MHSLETYTGTQAVLGACEPYSDDLDAVLLSMMYEFPGDRRDIMGVAEEVGRNLMERAMEEGLI